MTPPRHPKAAPYPLTSRARQLLAFIVTMERQGDEWNLRKAAHHMGLVSKANVMRCFDQLTERGYGFRSDGSFVPNANAYAAVPALAEYRFIPVAHRTSDAEAV